MRELQFWRKAVAASPSLSPKGRDELIVATEALCRVVREEQLATQRGVLETHAQAAVLRSAYLDSITKLADWLVIARATFQGEELRIPARFVRRVEPEPPEKLWDRAATWSRKKVADIFSDV